MIQISKYSTAALLAVFLPLSCSYLSSPLSDDDISHYLQAYENIAKISPELEAAREKDKAQSILTCSPCRDLLDSAVKKAGYSGYKSFLITDLRIHYAMQYVMYLKIANLVGGTVSDKGIPVELLCKKPNIREEMDKQKTQDFDKFCQRVSVIAGFIEKMGKFANILSEKLLQKGDLDTVNKHLDRIVTALTNPELIDEFNHTRGIDWDD